MHARTVARRLNESEWQLSDCLPATSTVVAQTNPGRKAEVGGPPARPCRCFSLSGQWMIQQWACSFYCWRQKVSKRTHITHPCSIQVFSFRCACTSFTSFTPTSFIAQGFPVHVLNRPPTLFSSGWPTNKLKGRAMSATTARNRCAASCFESSQDARCFARWTKDRWTGEACTGSALSQTKVRVNVNA